MKKKGDSKDSYNKFQKKHPIIAKKVDKTLKASITEGGLASVSLGLGASYLAPFALAMQATSAQIGILHAIASLVPSISQLGSCKLIRRFSRKKIIVIGSIAQALIWIPIMLTALLYFNNISSTIWILITLVGLFYIAGGVIYPPWFSLMGSLVPPKERGKYFSKRNRAAQFFGIITMILSAIFLDYMTKIGTQAEQTIAYTIFGFVTLFTLAMIIRLYCAALLSKHYEFKLKIHKKNHWSLFEFIKNAKTNPFGRFALYNASFWVAIGIAAPFFVVYILKELNYSYTWFIIITISSIISQIIFLTLIGKISDKFGNISLTKISTSIVALTPLTWAISYFIPGTLTTKIYLIFFAQLLNGIGWAGLHIATNNYVYDSMSQEKQGFAIAYMNLLVGIGAFLGALIGTAIIKFNIFTLNTIIVIFFASFIARSLVVLIGSKHLTEVKKVKKITPYYLLHEFHPLKETMTEIHHLNHLGNKFIHHKK